MLRADNRVLIAYGTCEEAILLAPLVMELRGVSDLRPIVAVPGTRSAVLDELHAMLRIEPEVDLDVLGGGSPLEGVIMLTLAGQTASFEHGSVLVRSLGVDVVVVAGDSPVALGVALTAFHARLPVVQVEAGVQSRVGELIAQVASVRLVDVPAWRVRVAVEILLGISRHPSAVSDEAVGAGSVGELSHID